MPFLSILIFGITTTLSAQYQNSFKVTWIEPGSGEILPEFDAFDSSDGTVGVLNAIGCRQHGRTSVLLLRSEPTGALA